MEREIERFMEMARFLVDIDEIKKGSLLRIETDKGEIEVTGAGSRIYIKMYVDDEIVRDVEIEADDPDDILREIVAILYEEGAKPLHLTSID